MKRLGAALLAILVACATLRGGLDTAARVWDVADRTFTDWTTAEADAIVDLRERGVIAEADRRAERLASAVARWDELSHAADASLRAGDADDVWEAATAGLELLRELKVLRR